MRANLLGQITVRPSPEGDDGAHQVLSLDPLDDPPTATPRQLRLDQRQMWALAARRLEGRFVRICLGDHAEPVQRPKHGHQRLAHLR
jgi:hypothetical protein